MFDKVIETKLVNNYRNYAEMTKMQHNSLCTIIEESDLMIVYENLRKDH